MGKSLNSYPNRKSENGISKKQNGFFFKYLSTYYKYLISNTIGDSERMKPSHICIYRKSADLKRSLFYFIFPFYTKYTSPPRPPNPAWSQYHPCNQVMNREVNKGLKNKNQFLAQVILFIQIKCTSKCSTYLSTFLVHFFST